MLGHVVPWGLSDETSTSISLQEGGTLRVLRELADLLSRTRHGTSRQQSSLKEDAIPEIS